MRISGKGGYSMLKQWIPAAKPDKEELDKRLDAAQEELLRLQMQIKEHKLPVLVLIEGWGAAGKGSTIGGIIKNIDPRFFKVASMSAPTEEEKREHFLYRYFVKIPEAGKFEFLDSGWMDEVTKGRLRGELSDKQYAERIESIKRFERQLTDNGYLVLKLFFQIGKKEQKKRLEELEASKDTAWRVGENDWWQNKHYDKCEEVFDKYLTDTNASVAPWYIIDSGDKKWAELQVLETLCSGIHVAMQNESLAVPILQNVFPLVKMPKLSEVELDKDAAGKGGNIKRIAGALDPRGYEVHPIASPEPHEKARHYLWRFWTRLPKTGHIAIFDRTWYGRVMVERLEGFCSTNDWQRAYNEINEFEKELSQWGAVIIKFWVQIDKDTQLERFTERQNTPEKQWKITDEDWRNRDKWDQILESVDKKYARIKALKIVIEELEKALG